MTRWRPESSNKDHIVTYGREARSLPLFLMRSVRRWLYLRLYRIGRGDNKLIMDWKLLVRYIFSLFSSTCYPQRYIYEEIEETHEISESRPIFPTDTSRIQTRSFPKELPHPRFWRERNLTDKDERKAGRPQPKLWMSPVISKKPTNHWIIQDARKNKSEIMNGCVYHKGIDKSSFAQCRSAGIFNTLHHIVCIGIHQSHLVHEETVVQDSDGIR
jgi:hypothetical protein